MGLPHIAICVYCIVHGERTFKIVCFCISCSLDLDLDLTGTLLQSIMTVTQRRGVLIKKECID